jgi:hypothetical protein
VLQDSSRYNDIIKTTPVERVFLPEKKLKMSMVFQLFRGFSESKNLCPRCQSAIVTTVDLGMDCSDCRLSFSKEEMNELEKSSSAVTETATNHRESVFKKSLSNDYKSDPNFQLDTIYDFARVRILENIKGPPGNAEGYSEEESSQRNRSGWYDSDDSDDYSPEPKTFDFRFRYPDPTSDYWYCGGCDKSGWGLGTPNSSIAEKCSLCSYPRHK